MWYITLSLYRIASPHKHRVPNRMVGKMVQEDSIPSHKLRNLLVQSLQLIRFDDLLLTLLREMCPPMYL